MTHGAVIFAQNNASLDYKKMAELLYILPDWGTGVGGKKEIELQYSISKKL